MTLDATCPPLVKSACACKHSSLEHTQVTFMDNLESVMASLTKHSAAESLLATSQSRHSVICQPVHGLHNSHRPPDTGRAAKNAHGTTIKHI